MPCSQSSRACSTIDERGSTARSGCGRSGRTQNGEAKAVLQSVTEYERTQETLALLRILAIGEQNVAEGKVRPAREVLEELRLKYSDG